MSFEIFTLERLNYGKGLDRGNIYEIQSKGRIISRVWQDTWSICIELVDKEPFFIKKDIWKIKYRDLDGKTVMRHPIEFGYPKTELLNSVYRFKCQFSNLFSKISHIDCTILQDESEVMNIHIDRQRRIFTSIDRLIFTGYAASNLDDPFIVSALILSFNDHAESIESSG